MEIGLKRKGEVLAFLMGSIDPNSPIYLLDGNLLMLIAGARCQSIRIASSIGNTITWVDQDDISILHRGFPDMDQPASIRNESQWLGYLDASYNGNHVTRWYHHGMNHRDGDLPAAIWSNGLLEWYKYDARHRDNDEPAIISVNGTRSWWQDGIRHRGNGLPAIEAPMGTFMWFVGGKFMGSSNDRDSGPSADL